MSTHPPPISTRTRRTTLAFLVGIYTLSMVDRQILAILVEPIKAELGLSDTQLGLLTGIAFAFFYATLGVPIARIADRRDRVTVISIALALWSGMTALCGFAPGFAQMALARVGVGVGEAGCIPAAHSMISDLFPVERRGSALSIFQLGAPLGMVTGLLAGGWLNEVWGWRAAFFVVGLPGLAVAVLARLVLRDPGRRSEAPHPGTDPGVLDAFRTLWRIVAFRHICIGISLSGFAQYALSTWLPAFFMRTHGLGTAEAGTLIAPVALFAGVSGTLLGGVVADRLGARDRRWYVWTPALALGLACPLVPLMLLEDEPVRAVVLAFVPSALGVVFMGPSFAMVQSLAPERLRATASAIALLLANLFGMGLGPLVVGLASDALEPRFGVDALRYALLITIAANLGSAFHYLRAGRTLRSELSSVE